MVLLVLNISFPIKISLTIKIEILKKSVQDVPWKIVSIIGSNATFT